MNDKKGKKKAVYLPSEVHRQLKIYAAENFMKLETLMLYLTIHGIENVDEVMKSHRKQAMRKVHNER
jgi:hypothetical protein